MNIRNITVPVLIFFYLPFSIYTFLIVIGQVIDAKLHWNYVTAEGVSFAVLSFLVWSLVSWVLGKSIMTQYRKDRKFAILALVPVVIFFGFYFIGYIINLK